MEVGRLLGSVHVGVEFLRVCLNQGRFLQLRVLVEVTEADPVIESDSSSQKQQREGPKVELWCESNISDRAPTGQGSIRVLTVKVME